jgi:hypothetical protein
MAQNPVSSKSTATNDTVESMDTFLEDHKKKMVEAYGTGLFFVTPSLLESHPLESHPLFSSRPLFSITFSSSD